MTAQIHSFKSAGVEISELTPAGRFSLRVRPSGVAAAAAALGVSLRTKVGAMASGKALRALCLGPDEWLLEMTGDARPSLPADLPHALVDISDREIVFRIEGQRAIELLSIGIARNVARINMGVGCRTTFDSAQVVLIRESETAFTLSVWRSFAPHVAELLAIGQRELACGL